MRKSLRWNIITAFALTGLLAGCLAWAAPETPAGDAAKPADEPQKSQPKVLARVDGNPITEEEVLQLLQSMGPQAMMMYGSPEGRRMLLDELVSMRLFALEGARAKLDETAEFRATMESLRMRVLAQAAMRQAIKDVSVTDEDAKKFYDEHPEHFTQPERVHARHILLNDETASADQIAKVQADLKAGVAFEELAKSLSQDPGSAPQGGDLGEFQRGQMVPEFEAAAFALKEPGDVSEPVKTQFGWHIIKLEKHIPSSPVPFETVKPQILQEVENAKISETLKARAEELKKSFNVEILEPEKPEKEAEPEPAKQSDVKN